MKLTGIAPYQDLSLNEKLAAELATAGQALINAAALLNGRPVKALASRNGPCNTSPGQSWLTVVELVNEFLLAKARAFRSVRYLAELRVSLKQFAAGRARVPIEHVQAADVERWMSREEWAPKTQRNYVSDVRTMFNYAVRRGYLVHNPAAGVELPVLDVRARTEVHTPDQVRTVLECARKFNLDACRHLAVRYFAGIRSAEAFRLVESDIKLEQGLIEVPATKAKTRARRLVTIQPNLKAWLQLGGEIRPMSPYTVYKLKQLTKIEWPPNVTRHSFISYHVAQFRKAHDTALEAGTSEQLVFSNYRALVTPAAAAEYWSIVPK